MASEIAGEFRLAAIPDLNALHQTAADNNRSHIHSVKVVFFFLVSVIAEVLLLSAINAFGPCGHNRPWLDPKHDLDGFSKTRAINITFCFL